MKRFALIAHDNLKSSLVDFVSKHTDFFEKVEIHSTGTTANRLLEKISSLKITAVNSGPLGGDLQIGSLIAEDKIDAMIFLWDPLAPQPHDVDIKALLRIAILKNIYVASNIQTAEAIISHAKEIGN